MQKTTKMLLDKNQIFPKELNTITLTINNACNLACDHCYLQYKGSAELVSDWILDRIFETDFKHLAIVGKEPLLDKKSVDKLSSIVNRATDNNRTVSVITNGLGLQNLKPEITDKVAFIDVSFDGGPVSYEGYRKGAFSKIMKGVEYQAENGFERFNALDVLCKETVNNVEDMMAVGDLFGFKHIMFSPYIETKNYGKNRVTRLTLAQILHALAESDKFMRTKNAFLLADQIHLMAEGMSTEEFIVLVENNGLKNKVEHVPYNPLFYGIIRITYDGYVLTPYESINTLDYAISPYKLKIDDGVRLSEVYSRFLKDGIEKERIE